MNDRTKLVLNGFLKLSVSEQNDLIRAINGTREQEPMEKRAYKSSILKDVQGMDLGPTNEVCTCCGR